MIIMIKATVTWWLSSNLDLLPDEWFQPQLKALFSMGLQLRTGETRLRFLNVSVACDLY